MKELKDILSVRQIQEEIQKNLGNAIDTNLYSYINEIIKKNSNPTSIIIDKENKYIFECTLHFDKHKNIYLLESRLFRKSDESMVNSHIRMLNSKLETIEDDIEDVWDYGDWKLAESSYTKKYKGSVSIVARLDFEIHANYLEEAKNKLLSSSCTFSLVAENGDIIKIPFYDWDFIFENYQDTSIPHLYNLEIE